MSDVLNLDGFRQKKGGRRPATVYFNRVELDQLLAVYSRRVASGEWRDYAIDQGKDSATFSIFRHAAERPLFAITKFPPGSQRQGEFMVSSGPHRLAQSQTLQTALAYFKRRNLKLIAGKR
ncbi:MAG: DUF2794 domain-containing protein [Alphaproteobacteria bacterium]